METAADVEEAFSKFLEWFYEDESDYTSQLIDKLEKFIEDSEYPEEIREMVKLKLEKSEEVKHMKADFELRDQALDIIGKVKAGVDDSWRKFTNYDSLKVWYKREEGLGLYTFYCEKLVRAPLFNLLSIIAEA